MPTFTLTRRGKVIGLVLFDWEDLDDWLIRNVRLEEFTDKALEKDLRRVLERNEPRLTIAGGHRGILWNYYEGLQAALWWLKEHGGAYVYELDEEPPDRVEDPSGVE